MTNSTAKTALTLSNLSVSAYRHELANGHIIEIVQSTDDADKWTIRSQDGKPYYSRHNGWTNEAESETLAEAVELVNKLEEVVAKAAPFDEAALRALYGTANDDWRFIRRQIVRYPELMQGLLDLHAEIQSQAPVHWQGLGRLNSRGAELITVELDKDHKYLASNLNGWLQDQNLYGLLYASE